MAELFPQRNETSMDQQTNADYPSVTQRQISDSRTQTCLLFENASLNQISFLEYQGTRARHHHHHKLYLPQVLKNDRTLPNRPCKQFADYILEVLNQISPNDLSSYVVSVRMGVLYFYSRSFRFKKNYSIEEIHDILQKKIPISNQQYYFPPRANSTQTDATLRSAFCNIKPISDTHQFVEELRNFGFHVKNQKHVFRLYLQSDDQQRHVCIIDPALNYSIVEFSKDIQRTSNIDYIHDRSSSKFRYNKTYDDIFDFRIQFQHNPRTCSNQMNTIEYELHHQFPSLDRNFRNDNILKPVQPDEKLFQISPQLCPYAKFLRRDFGDVYQYNGDDKLFENFTIYLESSVEYSIDDGQSIGKPVLDTHGLVYARLDLQTMISSDRINENLLIDKLWDMGTGLTRIAGRCTTPETQQSTNYYALNGEIYTAEDEFLVKRILQQTTLYSMLGLRYDATFDQISEKFNQVNQQLLNKWHCIGFGQKAREKLQTCYTQFYNEPY